MKFGQNLYQYSVPQWAVHNVDYDNLKKLIKQATTDTSIQAISIPGRESDDESIQGHDQDFYFALCEELDRVEAYCKLKYGEIRRRLDHNASKLDKVNISRIKLSMKRMERLSGIEGNIIKSGQELQLLSRFIGANRLAFVKLLKKFTKWGGSARLVSRFRRERLDQSEMINEQKDPLSKLLPQYTNLLETVRAPFEDRYRNAAAAASSDPNRIAHDLQHTFLHETQADFDAVFASSAVSPNGGRAVYWIHQDNLVQAHVLLQSVSNQRRRSTADSPNSQTKATTSPLNTFGPHWSGSGMVVCGLHDTIRKGHFDHPKATVYYTTSDKAVTLRLTADRLQLKRKDVALLLQTNYALPEGRDTSTFNTARSWLSQCPEVKPLVELGYTRTRFAGFSNCKSQGIWATLDNDIVMARPGEISEFKTFPHAVLDIRWEGKSKPEIIRRLDQKVIAERVQDFNLIVHAISAIFSESEPPRWMTILQNELRRTSIIDESSSTSNLLGAAKISSDTTVSDRPVSPFSTAQDHSSATSTHEYSELTDSLRRNNRKDTNKKNLQLPLAQEEQISTQPRYWNEFDDGDEEMQLGEPYAIDVYPEDEDVLFSMYSAFVKNIKKVIRRTGMKKNVPEQRPLLSSSSDRSSAGSEIIKANGNRPTTYSTFADHTATRLETPNVERILLARERVLFHATWLVYTMAASFLVMSLVIETIGRRKYSGESRVFSVFGILMSFVMALLGMICMMLRERTSIVGRSAVILGFGIVVVADALLMLGIWQNSG